MINKTKLQLNQSAKKAIDILTAGGFDAFVVGGSLRDALMGREIHDWDLCSSAKPTEVLNVFSDYKCIETGIKHGTITVIIDNTSLEITTFRTEGDYSDHRRPDSVSFTDDIHLDLARRDFTINSMAYNHNIGLVDIFSGKKHIEDKIISCVGNPHTRFNEDALRILRALRFSSVLGFTIEKNTEKAIFDLKETLKFVATERINSEFSKLICGVNAYEVLKKYFEIFKIIIPKLEELENCPQNHPYHSFDVLNHSLVAVKNSPPILSVRLALLFHDIGKKALRSTDENGVDHFYGHVGKSSYISEEIMDNLLYDNKTKSEVNWLIRHHSEILPITEQRMKRLLRKQEEIVVKNLIYVIRADVLSQNKSVAQNRLEFLDDALNLLENTKNSCFRLKDLEIGGRDLISIGFTKGPQIGLVLNQLLELVTDNKIPNQKNSLLLEAEKLKTAMYPQDQS